MFFDFFSWICRSDVVFLKTKNRIVFILILGGPNVAMSMVLAMILEIHVFSQVRFNESLVRFQCKNHVHWWSPRAQNSGNHCAKVIILVFFVFSVARNLEKNEKIMKCQSPYGVTHKGIPVIFITTQRSTCENRGFSRIALEFI